MVRLFGVLLLACPALASATLLSSVLVEGGKGKVTTELPAYAWIDFYLPPIGGCRDQEPNISLLGCEFFIEPNTTGTFTFDRNNAPGFDLVVGQLTDSAVDTYTQTTMTDASKTPAWGGSSQNAPHDLGLAGTQIDYIELIVLRNDLFWFVQPELTMALWNYKLSWQFYGTSPEAQTVSVPEPQTYGLMVAGLITAYLCRKRKPRRALTLARA